MNKKLFLKLGIGAAVIMAPLSFIACGQDAPVGIINPLNSNISSSDETAQKDETTQNSVNEDITETTSSENKKDENKTDEIKKTENKKTENKTDGNSQQKTEPKTENKTQSEEQKSENIEKNEETQESNKNKFEEEQAERDKQQAQLKTREEKLEFYYNIINNTMQKQIDYIVSLKDDPAAGQVQSSLGAAISQSVGLELSYPEDSEIISESLSKALEKHGLK